MLEAKNKPWRLALGEVAAQRVLLVHAVEAEDRSGRVLAQGDARAATQAARAASRVEAEWMGQRAAALVSSLNEEPAFARWLAVSFAARGLMPVAAAAFIVGMATNALGPSQRVHVLALPLLGLLGWNLTTLVLGLARGILPLAASGSRILDGLQRLVTRLSARSEAPREGAEEAGREAVLKRAGQRYLRDWAQAVRPLALARVRRAMHAFSLALVAGVVAGMYARGLALAYQATWESTFLGAATVQGLLDTVLAPASMLLGRPVPDVEAIRAPLAGDAGPWIHLWAVTAGWLVGLPRLVLVLGAWWRVWRLRRTLPVTLSARYRRRLLTAAGDVRHHLDILPYSYQPDAGAVAVLETVAREVLGPQTSIRIHPAAAYGDEGASVGLDPSPPAAGARVVLALFNLAQTPEQEVHGSWLTRVRDRSRDADAFLVVVDGEAYRARLGVTADAPRLVARRAAWDRVAAAAGSTIVHMLLGQSVTAESAEGWLAGAQPAGALEALTEGP